jgi:hypothetical protein
MVIARLLRTALLPKAARVLPSGKPTMDSRGILELALALRMASGGGSDERRKYYSHGTLANQMARLCSAGTNSLAIIVLKLRQFTSSQPCDRGEASFHDALLGVDAARTCRRGDRNQSHSFPNHPQVFPDG